MQKKDDRPYYEKYWWVPHLISVIALAVSITLTILLLLKQ
jgi:hypothetical protein